MLIFLSHSTQDREFVLSLDEALQAENFKTWLCEVDVELFDNFVAEIEKGLHEADLTLLIWSEAAARSDWTRVEWTAVLAREVSESRTRLGLILLDGAAVPELLRTKHRVKAFPDPDAARTELLDWLKLQRDRRRLAGERSTVKGLDFDPTDFVGRTEQLDRLHQALALEPGRLLLHGGPGSGKSYLARKFAWQTQGGFDAVVVQLCGDRPVEEIVAETVELLDLPAAESVPSDQIEAVRRWSAERRVLLVLDDLWREDALQLAAGPPVSLLATSRRFDWPGFAAPDLLEAPAFEEAEARRLFQINLGSQETERHWPVLAELTRQLGRLPIAVAVAADLLRHTFDPLPEAAHAVSLERLRNRVHDVPDLFREAVNALSASERRLLEAVAVCRPEGVWLPLAGEIAKLKEDVWREARDRLVRGSLLRVLDRDQQRFQIHALLRDTVRSMSDLGRLEQRHAQALADRFSQEDAGGWRELQPCLEEVAPAMRALIESGRIDQMRRLAHAGFMLGYRTGLPDAAYRIVVAERAFWEEDAETPSAKDDLQRCLGHQALILKAWGRLEEAMDLHREEERICRELGNRDGGAKRAGRERGAPVQVRVRIWFQARSKSASSGPKRLPRPAVVVLVLD